MKDRISSQATLLFVFFFIGVAVQAQQEVQFTQYLFNTVSVNPAYAGSGEELSVFGLHRAQWIGLEGAPVTSRLTVDMPLEDSGLGLAFSVVSDKIGPSDEATLSADFAYHFPISDSYQLAFGLKAAASWLNVDFTQLGTQYTYNDFVFQTNIDRRFSPNVGVGVYLHSDKTFVSLAAPNLLQTQFFDRKNSTAGSYIGKSLIHYYFQMGHEWEINEDLKFTPSLLTRYVQGSPLQVDLAGKCTIYDVFSVAISVRLGASVSSVLGFQISDSWFLGYGYDLDTSNLSRFVYNSHEVFLKYRIFNRN